MATLLLLLLPATKAAAESQVPEWLRGTWKTIDVYYPTSMSPARRAEWLRSRPLDLQDTVVITADLIDFGKTHLIPGGSTGLVVRDDTRPLSDYYKTDYAKNASGARIDLARLPAAAVIDAETCFSQSDRSDEGPLYNCLSLRVAKASKLGQAYFTYYLLKPNGWGEIEGIFLMQRTSPGTAPHSAQTQPPAR